MAFTFYNPTPLSAAQSGGFGDVLANALQKYQMLTQAKYMPKQIEADIFSKQIGPLATLSTNPMLLQNPRLQQSLGEFISKNLGGLIGTGNNQFNDQNITTYADQAQKDAEKAGIIAKELTKAGKLKTSASSGASLLQNYLGDAGKNLINYFLGNNLTPDLSNKEKQFDTYLSTLKNNVIQTNRMSPKDADILFKRRTDETPTQTLNRVKQSVPNLFEQNQDNEPPEEDQTYKDNQDLNFAQDLSQQIKERIGKDIPETLIFNYIQTHPGKVHIPSLLKAVGEK